MSERACPETQTTERWVLKRSKKDKCINRTYRFTKIPYLYMYAHWHICVYTQTFMKTIYTHIYLRSAVCVHAQSRLTLLQPRGLQHIRLLYLWDFWVRILDGLPFLFPRELFDPGIKPMSPMSPALGGGFFTTETPGQSYIYILICEFIL